jgi:hypothetical protein
MVSQAAVQGMDARRAQHVPLCVDYCSAVESAKSEVLRSIS